MTELLEREALRAVVSRGPCAWRKVAAIGAALADGLAAAHSKGVTHRDVKPENLFLTSDGQPKVLDFGLAIVDTPLTAETRTLTGMVAGTPGYLSPEQILGGQASPLSDIFRWVACCMKRPRESGCLRGIRPWRPCRRFCGMSRRS